MQLCSTITTIHINLPSFNIYQSLLISSTQFQFQSLFKNNNTCISRIGLISKLSHRACRLPCGTMCLICTDESLGIEHQGLRGIDGSADFSI